MSITPLSRKRGLSHFEVKALASSLWLKDGCPANRELDYWMRAETLLITRSQPFRERPLRESPGRT